MSIEQEWAKEFAWRAMAYTKAGVGSFEENMVSEYRCWLRFQMEKLTKDLAESLVKFRKDVME